MLNSAEQCCTVLSSAHSSPENVWATKEIKARVKDLKGGKATHSDSSLTVAHMLKRCESGVECLLFRSKLTDKESVCLILVGCLDPVT